MPLSTIFQLYSGGRLSFIGGGNWNTKKTMTYANELMG